MKDVSTTRVHSCAAVILVAVLLASLLIPADAQAKKKNTIESFTANVMVMSSPGRSNSSILTMNIYEWSSEEDRAKITEAIQEATDDPRSQNVRTVSRTLRKLDRVGILFLQGGRGWPIRYTRQLDSGDGGRQIVIALDRPVTFSEVYAGSQARDFDVTLIVLNLDSSGNGEGIASVGTEVVWNSAEDRIEITNFSSQPVRLTNVRPSN